MGNKEVWKPIVGYEGFYEVSSLGRVKSVARLVIRPGPRGNYRLSDSLLALHPNPKGYLTVKLSRGEGRQQTITVHRVVVTAFIPNPENKPQINHRNGVKTDNRATNLEWSTSEENSQHAWETGLIKRPCKYLVSCPELRLTTKGYPKMAENLRQMGYSATAKGVRSAVTNNGRHCGLRFIAEEINHAID